jgi:hypothetical protein
MNALSDTAFDQGTGAAKKAAEQVPVVITDGDGPAYVLMTYAAYQKMRRPHLSVAEALAMPDGGDFETEFPRIPWTFRDVDFD